ncbi:unnamed protein product [Bursaphelenchus okinawaensis]|uniref:EGF-like domain-containing protein n=1 Tax=Bursaphelenchus okinawaensis TaxID=465554 RepID=A0A811KE64_9BILA|nr:unnamed protein product [Bursaphelenchus okinawaensis]CAG9101949.1 unnamed protein product [Bursaphelenchus okinawaensis]
MSSISTVRKKLQASILILFLTSSTVSSLVFLKNQAECAVTCQNGGVCAYERENPHIHKCMCFIDMYYGDLCQFKYTDTSSTSTTPMPRIEKEEHEEYDKEYREEEKDHKVDSKEEYYGENEEHDPEDLIQDEEEARKHIHGQGQHPHSDELYHEAQVGGKASRAVAEHPNSRVYNEHDKDATFNKLNSYEQNNDDDYVYPEEEEDWMLVKKSSNGLIFPSILLLLSYILLV